MLSELFPESDLGQGSDYLGLMSVVLFVQQYIRGINGLQGVETY